MKLPDYLISKKKQECLSWFWYYLVRNWEQF